MNICPKCKQSLPPSGECPNCCDNSFHGNQGDFSNNYDPLSHRSNSYIYNLSVKDRVFSLIITLLAGIFGFVNALYITTKIMFQHEFPISLVFSAGLVIAYFAILFSLKKKEENGDSLSGLFYVTLIVFAINIVMINFLGI